LVLWGFDAEKEETGNRSAMRGLKKGSEFMKKIGSPLKKIFKSFIP